MDESEKEPWVNVRLRKHTQKKLKVLAAIADVSYSELLDKALQRVEKEIKDQEDD